MGRALCDTFPGTWTHAHSRADTCPGLTLISNCSSNICHSASAKYRVGQRDTSKRKDKRVSCCLSKCTLIYEFSTTNWAKFTTHLQSIHLQKIIYSWKLFCIHFILYPFLHPSAFLFLVPTKILSLHGSSYFSPTTKEVNFSLLRGTGRGRGPGCDDGIRQISHCKAF